MLFSVLLKMLSTLFMEQDLSLNPGLAGSASLSRHPAQGPLSQSPSAGITGKPPWAAGDLNTSLQVFMAGAFSVIQSPCLPLLFNFLSYVPESRLEYQIALSHHALQLLIALNVFQACFIYLKTFNRPDQVCHRVGLYYDLLDIIVMVRLVMVWWEVLQK